MSKIKTSEKEIQYVWDRIHKVHKEHGYFPIHLKGDSRFDGFPDFDEYFRYVKSKYQTFQDYDFDSSNIGGYVKRIQGHNTLLDAYKNGN